MPVVAAEKENLPVSLARAGNAQAWDTLFRRYQLPLYVYIFQMVHNDQSSLDLVQETFINAVRHIESLNNDEKFGSWLFGIAHQKCIQLWRGKGREQEAHDELADAFEEFEADPAELLIRREQHGEFMNLLEKLLPAHRETLVLHFFEEFSLEEIADITSTPVGTVKSRLYYAKRAFRDRWQRKEDKL
jgi:RNA polymerase sigma-70 factor (ECF subfamily)